MMAWLPYWLNGSRKYENVRHPYPALSSYADTDLDRSLFFGRKQEAENLLGQVLTSDLVLLFGRSGYGKTSLINAGVMEPLRKQNYFPVVCQLTHSFEETPLESIRSRLREAAAEEEVEIRSPDGCRSLWEFFYRSTFSKKGRRLRPVLILDQFEELFSRIAVEPQWGPQWQQQFIHELSDLVRRRVPENLKAAYIDEVESLPVESDDRRKLVDCLYGSGGPDVKVLIAIREDWLADLEALRPHIPAIFSSAMRLEPLTAKCARLAISQPAEHAALVGMEPFTFEQSALDQMIEFLSLDKRTGKPRAGACIEPAQLQILCYDLSVRRLRKGASTITARDLRGVHGMRRIIRTFYYRNLRHFPRLRLGWSARRWWPSFTNFLLFHRPRKSIARLCEYGLITASSYRNSVILDNIQRRFGVSKSDLDRLVNLRLLRAEPRLGTVFYELVHDTLVEPLRVIRRNRRLLRIVIIVGCFFTPWAIVGLYSAYVDWTTHRELKLASQTLDATDASPSDRANAFRKLAEKRKGDYSAAKLAGLNLNSVSVVNLSLARVDLRGATLQGASFTYVDFRQADLRNVDAQGASFNDSDFEEAKVAGMSIKEARFYGSNWWMAKGWSDPQLDLLKRNYPLATYIQSSVYRQTVSTKAGDINKATGEQKITLLNDLAWYRATNGAELLDAYADINKAINAGESEHRFHVLDTRAYIRLQLGEYTAAVSDLEEAAGLIGKQKEGDKPLPKGELYYHLGLAYEGVKDLTKAERAFKRANELGYEPTYERVLTPRKGQRGTAKRPQSNEASEYLRLLNN